MRTKKILLSLEYTIEIDDNSQVVKDYENDHELINHLVSYRFSSVLPVINNGVIVKSIEVVDSEVVE